MFERATLICLVRRLGAETLPGTAEAEHVSGLGEIHVVDDDPVVRTALDRLFSQAGYRVTTFPDGPSFLRAARESVPAGVVLDVYMPGLSGLDVLNEIDAPSFAAPIFVASAHGDIPTVVQAVKRGAYDFIDKRIGLADIVERMRTAIASIRREAARTEPELHHFPGRELLTPREHVILGHIVSGLSNQEIADHLRISRRTVEVHRAHVLAKTRARNGSDLTRIVLNHGRQYRPARSI